MKALGLRASNRECAIALIEGSRDDPRIVTTKKVVVPEGYADTESSRWLYQELLEVFNAHQPNVAAVKRPELSVKRSNALELRIGFEHIAMLAAAECGCTMAFRKVKSTIAKDLGLKGKGKYLKALDTSKVDGYDQLPPMTQEAVLVAWSCLS